MGHLGNPGFLGHLSSLYIGRNPGRLPLIDPLGYVGPPRASSTGDGQDRRMAIPVDQVIRERQFQASHPEWRIFSQDKGSRFIAECDDPNRVIVALSLRELLDRLETIVGADQ